MHIKPYAEVEGVKVAADDTRGVTMHVVIGPAQGAQNFTMRVFEVEPGGYTFLHHHDFEHEIFFHQGRGEVLYEKRTVPVGAGSIAFLPADVLHQIKNTGDEKMILVCVIPNRE